MRLSRVEYAPKTDASNILGFYMGKNTPERKDYIMENLVVPVESDASPNVCSSSLSASTRGRLFPRTRPTAHATAMQPRCSSHQLLIWPLISSRT
jgi:hypothetical protein